MPILQKKCAQIALVNKSNIKNLVIILQQDTHTQSTSCSCLLSLSLSLSISLSRMSLFFCSFYILSPLVVVAAVFQRNIAYQIELHLNISPFATATFAHALAHTLALIHTLRSSTRVQFNWVELSSVQFSTRRLVMHVCTIFQIVFVVNFHLFTASIDSLSSNSVNKLRI